MIGTLCTTLLVASALAPIHPCKGLDDYEKALRMTPLRDRPQAAIEGILPACGLSSQDLRNGSSDALKARFGERPNLTPCPQLTRPEYAALRALPIPNQIDAVYHRCGVADAGFAKLDELELLPGHPNRLVDGILLATGAFEWLRKVGVPVDEAGFIARCMAGVPVPVAVRELDGKRVVPTFRGGTEPTPGIEVELSTDELSVHGEPLCRLTQGSLPSSVLTWDERVEPLAKRLHEWAKNLKWDKESRAAVVSLVADEKIPYLTLMRVLRTADLSRFKSELILNRASREAPSGFKATLNPAKPLPVWTARAVTLAEPPLMTLKQYPSVQLHVSVEKRTFLVTGNGLPKKAIPMVDGDHRHRDLTEYFEKVLKSFPDERDVSLSIEPEAPYTLVVELLGVVDQVFRTVALFPREPERPPLSYLEVEGFRLGEVTFREEFQEETELLNFFAIKMRDLEKCEPDQMPRSNGLKLAVVVGKDGGMDSVILKASELGANSSSCVVERVRKWRAPMALPRTIHLNLGIVCEPRRKTPRPGSLESALPGE